MPFGGLVDIAPQSGDELPQSPNFEGVIGVLKPNTQNIESFIETAASNPTKLCTTIKTTKPVCEKGHEGPDPFCSVRS